MHVTVTGGSSEGYIAIGSSLFQMTQWTGLIQEGLLPMCPMVLALFHRRCRLPTKVQLDNMARPAFMAPPRDSTELRPKTQPAAVRFPRAFIYGRGLVSVRMKQSQRCIGAPIALDEPGDCRYCSSSYPDELDRHLGLE